MSPAQDLASHLTNPSGCQAFAPRRAVLAGTQRWSGADLRVHQERLIRAGQACAAAPEHEKGPHIREIV